MPRVASLLLLSLALSLSQASAQTSRALLIGINTYQPAGTTPEHPAGCTNGRCSLLSFDNLQGSVNDAQAMAQADQTTLQQTQADLTRAKAAVARWQTANALVKKTGM